MDTGRLVNVDDLLEEDLLDNHARCGIKAGLRPLNEARQTGKPSPKKKKLHHYYSCITTENLSSIYFKKIHIILKAKFEQQDCAQYGV